MDKISHAAKSTPQHGGQHREHTTVLEPPLLVLFKSPDSTRDMPASDSVSLRNGEASPPFSNDRDSYNESKPSAKPSASRKRAKQSAVPHVDERALVDPQPQQKSATPLSQPAGNVKRKREMHSAVLEVDQRVHHNSATLTAGSRLSAGDSDSSSTGLFSDNSDSEPEGEPGAKPSAIPCCAGDAIEMDCVFGNRQRQDAAEAEIQHYKDRYAGFPRVVLDQSWWGQDIVDRLAFSPPEFDRDAEQSREAAREERTLMVRDALCLLSPAQLAQTLDLINDEVSSDYFDYNYQRHIEDGKKYMIENYLTFMLLLDPGFRFDGFRFIDDTMEWEHDQRKDIAESEDRTPLRIFQRNYTTMDKIVERARAQRELCQLQGAQWSYRKVRFDYQVTIYHESFSCTMPWARYRSGRPTIPVLPPEGEWRKNLVVDVSVESGLFLRSALVNRRVEPCCDEATVMAYGPEGLLSHSSKQTFLRDPSYENDVLKMISEHIVGWNQLFLLDQYIWISDESEYAKIRDGPRFDEDTHRFFTMADRHGYPAPPIQLSDLEKYSSHIYPLLRRGYGVPCPNRPCFSEMKHLYMIPRDEWERYTRMFLMRHISYIPNTVYRTLLGIWEATLASHPVAEGEAAFRIYSVHGFFKERLWEGVTRFCIPRHVDDEALPTYHMGESRTDKRVERFFAVLERGLREAERQEQDDGEYICDPFALQQILDLEQNARGFPPSEAREAVLATHEDWASQWFLFETDPAEAEPLMRHIFEIEQDKLKYQQISHGDLEWRNGPHKTKIGMTEIGDLRPPGLVNTTHSTVYTGEDPRIGFADDREEREQAKLTLDNHLWPVYQGLDEIAPLDERQLGIDLPPYARPRSARPESIGR